jgi:hypothetical protein
MKEQKVWRPELGPQKPGEIPIEERVNEGDSQLEDFAPTRSGEKDAHLAITSGSPMRSWVYLGKEKTHGGKSTRRDSGIPAYLIDVAGVPNYVIVCPIRIGDKNWEYQTATDPTSIRRVFIERDQAIELDVNETLKWLSARTGPRRDKIEPLILEEANFDNINNQVIMQLMYQRIQEGKPMLPRNYGAHPFINPLTGEK